MRIVSLLPAATEMLALLKLQDRLVGVSHECDWPPGIKDLPAVTSSRIPADAPSSVIDQLVRQQAATAGESSALYQLNMELLQQLRPTLIVTQSLCDVCAVDQRQVQQAVSQLEGDVCILNLHVSSLEDMLAGLRQIAQTTGLAWGEEVIAGLQQRISQVLRRTQSLNEGRKALRVVVLEWLDPPFSCGHWTPQIVQLAGGQEALSQPGRRSRRITWQEVHSAQPDVLLVACCGQDVQRTLQDVRPLLAHPLWRTLPAMQKNRVYLLDGNAYLSRPGPRLVDALEIVAHSFHPDVHQLPTGLPQAVRMTEAFDLPASPNTPGDACVTRPFG